MEEKLLEFAVETEENHMGDIVANISKFGGLILGMEDADGIKKRVSYNMSMTQNYQYEKWLSSNPRIVATVSRVLPT